MSATFEVVEYHGAGGTQTVVTSMPLGSADSANLNPATYPVARGARSFEKWFKLRCTSLVGVTICDNFKVYLDPLITLAVGEAYKTSLVPNERSYVAATYPGGGPSAGAAICVNDVPLGIPSINNLGVGGALHGQITAINQVTDYATLQLAVGLDATVGALPSRDLILQWDER